MARDFKAARLQKGFLELQAVVGSPPPAEFNRLRKDELQSLTQLVGDALERHQESVAQAEDNIVNLAPRMLRGTVRRLLGVSH